MKKDISWEGDFPENTVALIGFPLDKGIERIGGRIGASRGPARIRKAFYRLANGCRHPINELTLLDLGDVVPQMDIETSHEQLGDIITFWIKKGILPIVLGGSHDLSFGSVSGLVQAIPGQEKMQLHHRRDIQVFIILLFCIPIVKNLPRLLNCYGKIIIPLMVLLIMEFPNQFTWKIPMETGLNFIVTDLQNNGQPMKMVTFCFIQKVWTCRIFFQHLKINRFI